MGLETKKNKQSTMSKHFETICFLKQYTMCGSNYKCKNLKTKLVTCFNPSITESEAEKGMAEFYGIVSFRY